MTRIRVCEDFDECRLIWQAAWPTACLFDLWPVRACFADAFAARPFFLVAESQGKIEGLLALSYLAEARKYGLFPGETWQGKTWLEQNKLPASSPHIFRELLASVPGPAQLRYLTREAVPADGYPVAVDEVGYLFFPGQHDFSFEAYMGQFSGKTRKKLAQEQSRLHGQGVSYRHDHWPDAGLVFSMNQEAFGEGSYFSDPRFLDGFERLVAWLASNNMLRVTTILVGGVVAAVDIGARWESSYTVLAGGTNHEFPGIAKMINFHHIQWACQQRLEVVDFLCSDFGWKKRFHLTPRPLYEMRVQAGQAFRQATAVVEGRLREY